MGFNNRFNVIRDSLLFKNEIDSIGICLMLDCPWYWPRRKKKRNAFPRFRLKCSMYCIAKRRIVNRKKEPWKTTNPTICPSMLTFVVLGSRSLLALLLPLDVLQSTHPSVGYAYGFQLKRSNQKKRKPQQSNRKGRCANRQWDEETKSVKFSLTSNFGTVKKTCAKHRHEEPHDGYAITFACFSICETLAWVLYMHVCACVWVFVQGSSDMVLSQKLTMEFTGYWQHKGCFRQFNVFPLIWLHQRCINIRCVDDDVLNYLFVICSTSQNGLLVFNLVVTAT